MPRCRAHSAGIRKPRAVSDSVNVALGKIAIGIDPAVAQEGPMGTNYTHGAKVAISHEDFLILACPCQDATSGIGDERSAPELDARCVCFAIR